MGNDWKKLSSWGIGVFLVVGAVISLLAVGWLGFRNLQDRVWNDARADCEQWAARLEGDLSVARLKELQGVEVLLFPELPEPGDVDFDTTADIAQLKVWRNSIKNSEAGIPVRLLAGLVLLKREVSTERAKNLADEAIFTAPSLMTPRFLKEIRDVSEEAGLPFDSGFYQEAWERDERARAMIRATEKEGFQAADGDVFWVTQSGPKSWKVLSPEALARIINTHLRAESLRHLRWMGAALKVSDGICGESGEVLVRKVVPGGVLELGVVDQQLLEAESRQQVRWIVLMMTLALLAVGLGLWMMVRGIMRERRVAYAKSQFVASVTHELRAPVGSMRLMAEALESGKVRAGKVGEFHRLMARESGRLSVLIENVMDLAKVESGNRVVSLEEIVLGDLVEEVCEMMSLAAGEKEVRFEQDGPELRVTMDAVALRQILVNLIDNAVKFSPTGGLVKISWGEGWWFRVADEGAGVPTEMQARVFERFFRGEEELRRTTQGVGIGLSLVKELVELHGGEVDVSNEDGAVFRVEFRK